METLLQDLRFGVRTLTKSPGFAVVALLTLALGIGANSAIFSVINAILLRPLAYKNPDQLVLINHNYQKINLKASVSAFGFAHYRDNAKSFESLAAITGWAANLTGEGDHLCRWRRFRRQEPRRGLESWILAATVWRRPKHFEQNPLAEWRKLHRRRRHAAELSIWPRNRNDRGFVVADCVYATATFLEQHHQ